MKKLLTIAASVAFIASGTSYANADGHGNKSANKGKKKIEKMDSNKDGTVSEAEFLAYKKEKFSKMDANSDGQLTAEELTAYYKAKKAERKAKKAEMEAKQDENKSGD